MKKAIIITGPTGVGKSALALKIAKQINGALISVDSIQAYKECDIISGKDIPQKAVRHPNLTKEGFDIGYWDIDGTPLYLTDITPPTYEFNVGDFLRLVKTVLPKIEESKRIPIFVGGSTLYIRSLLQPIDTASIPQNLKLRERLKDSTIEEQQIILAKHDRSRLANMNESDIQNSRRLIRAIEIAEYEKKHPNDLLPEETDQYTYMATCLIAPQDVLKDKIEKRIISRLQNGAISEAKNLYPRYNTLSPSIKNANGYKQIFKYIEGSSTEEEAMESWMQSELQNTKKQLTFFKKINEIHWYDVTRDLNNVYDDVILFTENEEICTRSNKH